MARKAIIDTYYTFSPSTRTVIIPRAIPKERLILITDVTTNQVLYNFSDPTLTSTSYAVATDSTGAYTTTTIVLNYNTTNLASTDKLQIVVDEYDEKFTPAETMMDPVNKLRVSQPQSLIDTDYEYSTQQTKWEQLNMINNRPFAWYLVTNNTLPLIDIQATVGSRTYTANVFPATAPLAGNAITVTDSLYGGADGTYIIDSNPTSNTMAYTGRFYSNVNGSIMNTGVTYAYQATPYSNAAIALSSVTYVGNLITVITANVHGLSLGNEIGITNLTASTNPPNGSWTVCTVANSTAFSYYATNVPTGTITSTAASLYTRPLGLTVHRPTQAGVRFSTNSSSHNQQYIRQTRRYFRYQSGKGIQMSTGTTFKSNMFIDSITYNSATNLATVKTKDPHNVTVSGVYVNILYCNETAYNGTFLVNTVVDPYTFAYVPTSVPTSPQASGNYTAAVSSWYSGVIRVGMFDSQNGMFFEFDGQTLYAVRRSSTYNLSGTIAATTGSNVITGTGTAFTKQLVPNDFVVIKGMSYRVVNIISDTVLTITPAYRGLTNITSAVMSRTVDTRVPQSQWSLDRCDGTGPSGYKIDLTKIQMCYLDYSWYGAGFIRWGFRGSDGKVIYCHTMLNNNVNQIAYMRSGNLPARYESNTFANSTVLLGNVASTDTQILLTNLPQPWPPSGVAVIRNTTQQEYVYFTGNTINSNGSAYLTGLTRGQPGANQTCTYVAGNAIMTTANTLFLQPGMYVTGNGIPVQAYVSSIVANTSITLSTAPFYSNTQSLIFAPLGQTAQAFVANTAPNGPTTTPTVVEFHGPSYSPEVNHWGTSAIMDGQFTNDKQYIFTKGMTQFANVYPGQSNAIMSFRLAPSASQGQPGTSLGVRDIINRMQFVPFELDAYSNGSFLMSVVLNGTVSNSLPGWQNVGGSSLSQYQFHNANTTVSGGETVFGFYMNTTGATLAGGPGSGTTYNTTQQDFSQVKDLGTSILSGGQSSGNVQVYPDGPDVMTIVATNLTPSTYTFPANLVARLSWTEAQA